MLTRSLQRASLVLAHDAQQALIRSSVVCQVLKDGGRKNLVFAKAHDAAHEMRNLTSYRKANFSNDVKKEARRKNSDDPYEEDEFAKEEETHYEH
jgi:hypothetical protein